MWSHQTAAVAVKFSDASRAGRRNAAAKCITFAFSVGERYFCKVNYHLLRTHQSRNLVLSLPASQGHSTRWYFRVWALPTWVPRYLGVHLLLQGRSFLEIAGRCNPRRKPRSVQSAIRSTPCYLESAELAESVIFVRRDAGGRRYFS